MNKALEYTQSIMYSDRKVKLINIKVIQIAEYFRQCKIRVKLPDKKFETTIGQMEAAWMCIEKIIKDLNEK